MSTCSRKVAKAQSTDCIMYPGLATVTITRLPMEFYTAAVLNTGNRSSSSIGTRRKCSDRDFNALYRRVRSLIACSKIRSSSYFAPNDDRFLLFLIFFHPPRVNNFNRDKDLAVNLGRARQKTFPSTFLNESSVIYISLMAFLFVVIVRRREMNNCTVASRC